MALARAAALLAARQGGPLLSPSLRSLGAVAGLQQLQAHAAGQPGWWQARGFAAGGSTDDGKPVPPPPEQAEPPQPSAAAAAQERATQQPEQQPAASAGPAADSSSSSGGGGGGGGGGEEAPLGPTMVEQHNPALLQYIEQLKQLKGSSTVQRQTVGGDVPWWKVLIAGWLGPRVQAWISDFVRAKVESSFEPEEWLEGAKDAFHTVHELLAEGDWDGLRPMMSAKLHAAYKDTAETYQREGFVYRTALSGPLEAQLRGMGFANRQQMAVYDPDIAEAAPEDVPLDARPTGLFLVLTVQLKTEQLTTITREADGLVVAELKDLRPQTWKFATGPLPGGLPVSRLDTEWFLLSI